MNFPKLKEEIKAMVAAGAKIQDELLPELEISIIPSKLSDNVKLDLYSLSDDFMDFLIERGCIEDDPNNDTQYMSMSQAIGFCKTVRDLYRTFNMEAASANL